MVYYMVHVHKQNYAVSVARTYSQGHQSHMSECQLIVQALPLYSLAQLGRLVHTAKVVEQPNMLTARLQRCSEDQVPYHQKRTKAHRTPEHSLRSTLSFTRSLQLLVAFAKVLRSQK